MDFTSRLFAWSPQVLSIMRIAAALLFMQHGTMKLLDLRRDNQGESGASIKMRMPAGWNAGRA